jgi:hypothetical protein
MAKSRPILLAIFARNLLALMIVYCLHAFVIAVPREKVRW